MAHHQQHGGGAKSGDGKPAAPVAKEKFRYVDPKRVKVTSLPGGAYRAEVMGERTVLRAKFVRAFPVSNRDRYIEIKDGAGNSVGMMKDLEGMDADSLQCVKSCLEGHYFVPVIREVYSMRGVLEMQVWHVGTDRGEMEFSVTDVNRNVRHVPPRRLLITDTDQNIYDIPDWSQLDLASRLRIKDISQVVPEGE